jgi:Ferric reductase like transmembrane component
MARAAAGRVIASSLSSSKAVWYLTRGTGAVSLLLLTAVTVLGILNSVRWTPQGTPRFVLQRVHRNVSLLSVVFIVLHIATAVIDGFAPIRWLDAVVPFGSAYRPLWLGFGAVAFDLVIAVIVTSLLRARLGYRAWRAVHWTAYACWAVAIFHGLGIGSDSTQLWMLVLVSGSVLAVALATVWRTSVGWPAWTPARITMALGLVAVPIVLAVWFLGGPLQPGWAARAGTPTQLLSHVEPSRRSASSDPRSVDPAPRPVVTPSVKPLVLPASADVRGTTRLHRLSEGRARVDISLQTKGSPRLQIKIVLNGQAVGGGVSMSNGSVVLTPPRGAEPYQGNVTQLSGGNIGATLSDANGDEIQLAVELQISGSGASTGRLLIQPGAGEASQI